MIDSITEYSVQIANAGGDAGTLFNLLNTGFQGVGTLGTDKAIDLFKEFRVRLQDGSDTTKKAFKQLGIDQADMNSKLASGTMSVTDAFDIVISKMRTIDNSTIVMQAGVGLMGTQFEDLGQQAALSLSTVGVEAKDLVGATNKIDVMYTSLSSVITAMGRSIQLTFAPLNAALLSLGNYLLPMVQGAFDGLLPFITRVSDYITYIITLLTSGNWEQAGIVVQNAFGNMVAGILDYLNTFLSSAFSWGANLVIQMANGIIETAATAIVQAATYVSELIASMWRGNSPPPKGPLSTIDKWGANLVDTFGDSFTTSNASFIKEASVPIKKFFEDMYGSNKTYKAPYEAFKTDFRSLVEEISSTGQINNTVFDSMISKLGEGNDEMKEYVTLQLKSRQASKQLYDLEKEFSAAVKAGNVTPELMRRLNAARTQSEILNNTATEQNTSIAEKYTK